MNNTYSLIISQSERAWSFQWARTLFALERRLSDRERVVYLRKYSINMVASSSAAQEESEEDSDGKRGLSSVSEVVAEGGARYVPGLMIIKRMDYTRAERRRFVFGCWRVSSFWQARSEILQLTNPPRPLQRSIRAVLEERLGPRLERHL